MNPRLVVPALALTAALAFASLASARPWGGHGWLAGVPQDKQEQVAKLYSEGRQKLYDLESRKWAKQAELNALLAQPRPESAKIEALAKEIGTLGSMIYQERVALQQRILKETGVNVPLAGGGYGGGGYGPGCGEGGPFNKGRGYGPGMRGGNQTLPPCCETPGQQAPGQQPQAQ